MYELDLEAYEDLSASASRWNVFAGILRTYQAYLKDNGYNALSTNGYVLNQFEDSSSLTPAAQEEAKIMLSLEMLSGTEEDGKLYMHMSDNIKRGEVAKIVACFYQRLNPIDVERNYVYFSDLNGHWSEPYVQYCYERNLVNGRDNNYYDPEGYITKEEAIQILLNMEEKNSINSVSISNIAKAINETYKCATAFDEENRSTTTSTTSNQNLAITPEAYAYTITQGHQVPITIKFASNRKLQVTAVNSACSITRKTTSGSTMNIIVQGDYPGTGFLRCSYTDGNNYEELYIPIFVKTYYSNNSYNNTSVTINENNISMRAGQTYQMSNYATVYPQYSETYYATSNPTVAYVNYVTGEIRAVSKGSCYLYVLTDGDIKKVKATVTGTSSSLPGYNSGFGFYGNSYGTIALNSSFNMNQVVYNTTGYSLKFSSSKSSVASVSSTGVVTPKKYGTTDITVTCNNQKIVYELTVSNYTDIGNYNNNWNNNYNGSLSFRYSSYGTLGVGDTMEMSNLVNNMTGYKLSYSSSSTSVATVSSTGRVTAKKAGNANITVRCNGNSIIYYLTVVSSGYNRGEVQSIQFMRDDFATIAVDEEFDLDEYVVTYPTYASSSNLKYSSSDTSVAKVGRSSGIITGVGTGEAIITVTCDYAENYFYISVDDSKVSTKSITVKNDTVTVKVGEEYQLANDVTVTPSNHTDTVIYTSSDPNTAFVGTSSGTIIGMKEGNATITIKAGNVSKTVKVNIAGTAEPTPTDTPTVTPTPVPSPTTTPTNPTNDGISFLISDTIQLKVGAEFNPYSVLTGNTDGVTFSFTVDGIAQMSNGRVRGIAAGDTVLVATNSKGKTATLPFKIY